jgi:hypothetical protein
MALGKPAVVSIHQFEMHEVGHREGLWKKVKRDATHLRYFPHFADLIAKEDDTLTRLAGMPHELTALAGEYRELTALAA